MPNENPYKQMLQNAVHSFLDTFAASDLHSRTLTDGQIESMQFGSYSFVPKPSEEISYFHY